MDLPIKGGCNCGAVKYELTEAPITVLACHCENCRRQSGAAYSVNLAMKASAVEVDGALSTFEDKATESGQMVNRDFCGTCGSPIRSRPTSGPPVVAIKAGTLDDPSPFPPALHIWTCTKLDWVEIPEGLPQIERNMPR